MKLPSGVRWGWVLLGCTVSHGGWGQYAIGSGPIVGIYQEMCANCHGQNMAGGTGGPLVGMERWGDHLDDRYARIIRDGAAEGAMPAYGDVLSEEQIRSLVIYIREQHHILKEKGPEIEPANRDITEGVHISEEGSFRAEEIFGTSGTIWSFDYLPDRTLLVAQFSGTLWKMEAGGTAKAVEGTPRVVQNGQGGLLEVAVHPEFEDTGWIYLAFSTGPIGQRETMTKIVRGRINDRNQWVDEETIFEVEPRFLMPTRHHFGTRLVFHEGYLFFSIGDRGRQNMAQDLSNPNGKIHRIFDDGRIPEDNPFRGQPSAFPTIWTYGNRNPQGLVRDASTGLLWSTEHGPRGGDELNLIRKGVNYGWPVITHGMNYNGTPITGLTAKEGMEQPVVHWTPSIAVCGMHIATGKTVPGWEGDLFVTGLVTEELRRIVLEGETVVHQEVVLKDFGRVRDVGIDPDGFLVIALMTADRSSGRLIRLLPHSDS